MNTHVNFQTAKLLKEKGFNLNINTYYEKNHGSININLYEGSVTNNSILAPTIAHVVMWLYEKHGIWIVPSYEFEQNSFKEEWFWIVIKGGEEIGYQYSGFNSPKEAYEEAIGYCLNNLLKGEIHNE